jgi:hypothetical protein
MNVTRHNYEEYFLRYVDNELETEERRWVEQFARENPDLDEELSALKSAVLDAEEVLYFGDKGLLYREEATAAGSSRVIPLWKKAIPAVAAAILLLGAGAFWLRQENLPGKTSGGVASTGTAAQAAGSPATGSQPAGAPATGSSSATAQSAGSQAAGSQTAAAQTGGAQPIGSQTAGAPATGSQPATAEAGGSQSAGSQSATAETGGAHSITAQTAGPATSPIKPATGPAHYAPPANPGQTNTQTATVASNPTLPGNSLSPANSILPGLVLTAQSNKTVPSTAPGTTDTMAPGTTGAMAPGTTGTMAPGTTGATAPAAIAAENKPASVTIAHAASYHTLEDGDQKDEGNKILFVRADQVINGGVKGFFRRAGRVLKRSTALSSDNIHPETDSDK